MYFFSGGKLPTYLSLCFFVFLPLLTAHGEPAETVPLAATKKSGGDPGMPALDAETQEQAGAMIEEATKRALDAKAAQADQAQTPPGQDVVRINYVPESIRNEIRDQVRAGLREDVLNDVLEKAKSERWGIPGATPEWVERIKWAGDFRMRGEGDHFAGDNIAYSYFDFQRVNEKGGFGPAGLGAYSNTTEDRERLRIRARLNMAVNLGPTSKSGFRVTTGDTKNPVSTNQTLGNTGGRYGMVWDRAYYYRDFIGDDSYPLLSVTAGRMANPFLSTDLVWDDDVGFDGLALKYQVNLRGADSLLEMTERDRLLYLTVGAFPIQEVELASRDKWLYGAQLGSEFHFLSQSSVDLAVGYYHFVNITGKRNAYFGEGVVDTTYDYTAPSFMQKGNTLFDIRNDRNDSTDLWALAADYHELNLTANYDMVLTAPLHANISLDYVKNIGYDKKQVVRRSGGAIARAGQVDPENPFAPRTTGYQVKLGFGWPNVGYRGNWRMFLAYKYLQRDAVLDAFTDSDFHLGGTDAEGWVLGFDYGVDDNAWAGLRYITADAIDGLPMGVDVLQIDFTTKF